MRPSIFILALIQLSTLVLGAADPVTFTTKSGREFQDAVATRVEGDQVSLQFSGGIVRLPVSEIPGEALKKMGVNVSELLTTNSSSLAELKLILEAELENDKTAILQFEEKYAAHLEKLSADVQSKGEFELLVLVKRELEEFRDEKERDYSGFKQLQSLRSVYESNIAKLKEQVREKNVQTMNIYLTKLGSLKKRETQSGNLAKAVEIDAEEKRVKAIIEKNSAVPNQKPTEIANGPFGLSPDEEILFKLSSGDFELVEQCKMDREGDYWKLTAPSYTRARILTKDDFEAPFRVSVKASTQADLRYYWGKPTDGEFIIFNWNRNPKVLRMKDVTGKISGIKSFPDQGFLQPGQTYHLELLVEEDKISVLADQKVRATLEGDFTGFSGRIGFGPHGDDINLPGIHLYDMIVSRPIEGAP